MCRYICNSLSDTEIVARSFAKTIQKGSCLALCGDLGCGKTTFARFVIRELNPAISIIPSPTFSIIQTYPSDKGEIFHVDCYRLQDASEVRELGLIESLYSSISLIEWPDIIKQYLPSNCVYLKFIRDDNVLIIEQLDG